MERRAHPLWSLDLVVVTGKGGVGKTTVAAAMAVQAARAGVKVLFAQCQARDHVHDALETTPLSDEIRMLGPNLWAVNMTPSAAIAEYGMMVLKIRALYKAVLDNRIAKTFIHGIPGMDPWSMLGKAYHHATRDVDRAGRRRFDLVILDAPATGHGFDMLRVPQVIAEVAPPGLLRREAEQAHALLTDPRRAGIVLVTLPALGPVIETEELHARIATELKYPQRLLVCNRMGGRTSLGAGFVVDGGIQGGSFVGTQELTQLNPTQPNPVEATSSGAAEVRGGAERLDETAGASSRGARRDALASDAVHALALDALRASAKASRPDMMPVLDAMERWDAERQMQEASWARLASIGLARVALPDFGDEPLTRKHLDMLGARLDAGR